MIPVPVPEGMLQFVKVAVDPGSAETGAVTFVADLINGTVARALSKIALDAGIPVLNGIVAAQNLEQAVERAGTKQGNKGWDALLAAIETVAVLKAL